MNQIAEVPIGHDGIVIANSKAAASVALTLRDLWLALARELPDPPDGTL